MTDVVIIDPGPPTIVQVVDAGPVVQIIQDVPTVVNIVEAAGPQGATGPQGPPGVLVPLTLQTDDTVSKGMAVYVSGVTGHFARAIASSVATSTVVGLVDADTAPGFAANASRDAITLSDWTAITGSALLVPGADYFLSPTSSGGLTLTPPSAAGQCVVHVGVALSTVELVLSLGDPILL